MRFNAKKISRKTKQKLLCIALGIVLFQIIFFISFQFFINSQKNALERKYSFSDKNRVYKNLADQRLTLQEYKQEIQEMTDLINQKDPSVALSKFKEEMNTNPKILEGCHELLHQIGRISYKKYNNLSTAMQYRDEVCVGGYIHGVIEGYFGSSKPSFSKMDATCSQYTTGTYSRWDCFHGMGHGLMLYANNDVPESLVGCDAIKGQFDQTACYSGTYMENFNADTVYHPSRYLNLQNPFSLCVKDTKHPGQCYTNAPFAFLNYYNNNYTGALEWCDEVPEVYRNICYEGVGSQITRRNVNDSRNIEKLCMSGGVKKTSSCIAGVADWYMGQYSSMAQVEEKCRKFSFAENRQICLQTVVNNAGLFRK